VADEQIIILLETIDDSELQGSKYAASARKMGG
jgi:hypothetical protein